MIDTNRPCPGTVITSRANPAVKRVRALRQRKERERTGLFFVEGIRLVAEAVQLGAPVVHLIAAPGLLERHPFAQELVERQRASGTPCLTVSDEVFTSIATREHPQGLAAVLRQQWTGLEPARADEGLCWVALERAQDPGNLGTILRTADAVGAAGVILLGNATDPYDPTAIRASMGAIFAQHLVRATWDGFLAWAAATGCQIVGTSDAAVDDYSAVTYPRPLVLLMGSEREGLALEQQRAVDRMVRIPMIGRSDSLNLAVATAIMLYEVFNQARGRQPAPAQGRAPTSREGTPT
jgi:TrmH family RNA methyltransferase